MMYEFQFESDRERMDRVNREFWKAALKRRDDRIEAERQRVRREKRLNLRWSKFFYGFALFDGFALAFGGDAYWPTGLIGILLSIVAAIALDSWLADAIQEVER